MRSGRPEMAITAERDAALGGGWGSARWRSPAGGAEASRGHRALEVARDQPNHRDNQQGTESRWDCAPDARQAH